MGRNTAFDYLRLAGASIVVLGHSWALLDRPPLFGIGWHAYGLILFFVVSGYLITGSWMADPQVVRFAEKRVRRIMPALLAVVALTVFVLGPLITVDPKYFTDPETYKYLWRNSVLLPYSTLPGLFINNPLPAVNGSLWTLPVEAFMYALTPLLVRAGPWACIAGAIAMWLFPIHGEVADFGLDGAGWITKFYLAGAALRMWRFSLPDLHLQRLPADLSYGIYLTAMPVQQTIIMLYPYIDPGQLTLFTLAVCSPLAWLSWTLVELPAMRGRHHVNLLDSKVRGRIYSRHHH